MAGIASSLPRRIERVVQASDGFVIPMPDAPAAEDLTDVASTVVAAPPAAETAHEEELPVPTGSLHPIRDRLVAVLVPVAVGALFLGFWEWIVAYLAIQKFVLPPPSMIWAALISDFPSLMASFAITLRVTVGAFLLALVSGVAIAVLFVQNRAIEIALFPYAIILQVTPIVAIAPLVIIWVGFENVEYAVLILAWIVAFFPILSNATLGLSSADHNLRDLFALYGASRWQVFRYLQFPTALPFILGGARISGGLALIGAVVAEFVAGSGTATGLAWRVIESGNRLNIPAMFAALILLSALGITIFFCLTWVQHLLLHRWHESAVRRSR